MKNAAPEKAGRAGLWLLGLTVVALGLRLINLDSGLWLDEIYALVDQFRQPVSTLVTVFVSDNQHPLYAVLASASVSLFGESNWSIRLPAVLFGAASVPALYFLGREVSNRHEGLLSAALLTFSYHHVWFSQNARGYTILAFAAILSTLYFARLLRAPNRRDAWLYAVIVGFGCYAHLTLVFVVAGHGLVWLYLTAVRTWRRDMSTARYLPLLALLASGALTLLLYGPILGQVLDFFVNKPSQLQGIATPMWALVEAFRSLSVGFGTGAVVVVAGALALVGLVSYLRTNPVAAGLFVTPVMVTIVGAAIARGTMYPRFFFALIGFGILIGVRGTMVSCQWLAHRFTKADQDLARNLATAAVVMGIAVSGVTVLRNYQYPKTDFLGAKNWVVSQAGPADRVVVAGIAAWPYQNYYGIQWKKVRSLADLENSNQGDGWTWVVYTFPHFIASRQPDLMAALSRSCVDKKRFRGTLGGGDVIVCRMQRASASERKP